MSLLICLQLSPTDILHLNQASASSHIVVLSNVKPARQTCKFFNSITLAKQLWLEILKREFAMDHFPFPTSHRAPHSLSDLQTKLLVIHSLRLRRKMENPHRPHVRSKPQLVPFHQTRQVTLATPFESSMYLHCVTDELHVEIPL